ncbi:MAG: sulfite exporter TauE/SafE family protein, partial [Planctomycetaceae bacterium]
FGGVMLAAAWFMFRNATKSSLPASPAAAAAGNETLYAAHHPLWQIALEGVVVGVLTGLVGVGGGFLIVPALVVLGGLPMRIAVGTSLAIIGLNSAVGFSKYLGVLEAARLHVDWHTVGLFIGIGIVGSQTGRFLSNRLDQATLRKVFAAFLVLMGLFVLGKEAPRLLAEPPVNTPAVQHLPDNNERLNSGADHVDNVHIPDSAAAH